MIQDKDVKERAHDLVSTSVDDLQSSLYFYDGTNPVHLEILEHGLKICKRRGEKTKAKLLKSKINKLQKAPIALSGTSPISKPEMGEEETEVQHASV